MRQVKMTLAAVALTLGLCACRPDDPGLVEGPGTIEYETMATLMVSIDKEVPIDEEGWIRIDRQEHSEQHVFAGDKATWTMHCTNCEEEGVRLQFKVTDFQPLAVKVDKALKKYQAEVNKMMTLLKPEGDAYELVATTETEELALRELALRELLELNPGALDPRALSPDKVKIDLPMDPDSEEWPAAGEEISSGVVRPFLGCQIYKFTWEVKRDGASDDTAAIWDPHIEVHGGRPPI